MVCVCITTEISSLLCVYHKGYMIFHVFVSQQIYDIFCVCVCKWPCIYKCVQKYNRYMIKGSVRIEYLPEWTNYQRWYMNKRKVWMEIE